mmetsp:Transcript_22061/g.51448  ORF Transcript_22061/g.51448 Transcript_22061/m.51448 type:complete len:84 (+) Transcript_22061:69-320(+)
MKCHGAGHLGIEHTNSRAREELHPMKKLEASKDVHKLVTKVDTGMVQGTSCLWHSSTCHRGLTRLLLRRLLNTIPLKEVAAMY